MQLQQRTLILRYLTGDRRHDDKVVTIDLERIDKGAKVILTYTFEGAPDYAEAVVVDDNLPPTGIGDEVTAFSVTTSVPVRAGTAGQPV